MVFCSQFLLYLIIVSMSTIYFFYLPLMIAVALRAPVAEQPPLQPSGIQLVQVIFLHQYLFLVAPCAR